MTITSERVEVLIGPVVSRVVGPAPGAALDRALNPLGPPRPAEPDGVRRAAVFDPVDRTVLTGALPAVKRALRSAGVRYRLRDLRERARGEPWRVHGPPLRPYQVEVVERAVARGFGMIDVGTGGGKTVLAATIAARLGRPTLWLVTTRTLLRQTAAVLERLYGQRPAVIGEGRRAEGRVTVALVQALAAGGTPRAWRGGTLVFDEGHHAAAASYLDVVRAVEPRYHFYLSAVPFREGPDQAVLDALTGGSLTGGRFRARYLIERGYACPVRVEVLRHRVPCSTLEAPFAWIYEHGIVRCPERNRRLAAVVRRELAHGRSVLVLVERLAHGQALAARIGAQARFVSGSTPGGELAAATADFPEGRLRCLVATAGLFQEGVSLDGIEVLVAAGGLRSRRKVIQGLGRGMRRAPGKRWCLYVDVLDEDDGGVLREHALARLRVLREEGFEVVAESEDGGEVGEGPPVPPAWHHIPGTTKFALVTAEGEVVALAECMRRPEPLPRRCVRCEMDLCQRGGRIVWRVGSEVRG